MMEAHGTFLGYPRANGQVGVRNHPLVMATCDCAYEEARRMAAAIPGAVVVGQFHGCGADPMVVQQMVGIANNPNVGAVLLVGLGCETISVDRLADGMDATAKPVESLVIQRDGGSLKAIEAGTRLLREMAALLSTQQRQPCDIARLTVALQCGGSDATSGIAANPAVGVATDRLVAAGATVLFSETVELIGTGRLLAPRAVSPEVASLIQRAIADEVWRGKATGISGRSLPKGNEDGGITTIEEKALGNILKSGASPIQGVLENSRERLERPTRPGLYLQNGTAWDVASITHMAAVGAQLAIFTTGRGSTTGHAILPVIKVTGNPDTFRNMSDNMDVDAGRIILGQAGITQVGEEIVALALAVASGAKPKAEALGFTDFQMFRRDAVVENMLRRCR